MKSSGDIFDFTSGERLPKVQDPVAAIEMATEVLCAQLRLEFVAPDSEEDASAYLDDFLFAVRGAGPDLHTGPSGPGYDSAYWDRWAEVVRSSVTEVFLAYRAAFDALGARASSAWYLGLARVLVEMTRWNHLCRQVPDPDLWVQLGTLFSESVDPQEGRVIGDRKGVAQEFLRAIAYHSAALDQLSVKAALATCRLIDFVLPLLVLQRESTPGALYVISPSEAPVPVRVFRDVPAPTAWSFVPGAALENFSELHPRLLSAQAPTALAGGAPGLLCDAVMHLLRLWSHRPPVRRFRRHPVDAELLVVRGYEAVRYLFVASTAVDNGAWMVTDLSKGGVGAFVIRDTVDSAPENGDLLAFRPRDGSNWHLGFVRRVLFAGGGAEVGIETLSVRPALIRVDDGKAPVDMFFCDPVLRGEAVRIIAPLNTIRKDVPLFVTADGKVSKLKPLDVSMEGRGFELRVYQVL